MSEDLSEIATRLWDARRNGGLIATPDPGLSERRAYEIQQALIDARPDAPAGCKVGATGAGAPAALGLGGPLAGPLWRETILDVGESSALVPLFPAHRSQAEVEIAFHIARTPADPSPEAVAACIGAIGLALEFTGNRLDPMPSPVGPGFVADHGGNGAVVLGPAGHAVALDDLPSLTVHLDIAGAQVKSGRGDSVLGHPLNALVWLIGHLAGRGVQLQAGQVVLTGAVVPLTAGGVRGRDRRPCPRV